MESHIKKYLIISAALFAVFFFLYEHEAEIYGLLNTWKIVQQHQRFTELYFNDVYNIPEHISSGEKIPFSFVVHNLEGGSIQYPYDVYFKSSDGKVQQIEENTLMLKDGESETVNESYTAGSDGNIGSIVVVLKDQSQEVHFLLD